VDVEPKAEAKILEPVKAPQAVQAVVDDPAQVLEKVQEMRAVGQAQLDGSLAETEAVVNQDDT
jgi:hypothetical protein